MSYWDVAQQPTAPRLELIVSARPWLLLNNRGLTYGWTNKSDTDRGHCKKPFLAMAVAGGLPGTLKAMIADKNVYRSPQALGPAYEHSELVSDETIEQYFCPLVRNEQRTRDFQRFLAAFDNKHTLAIEDRLKTLKAPTLIAWGTDDVYFDVKWATGSLRRSRVAVDMSSSRAPESFSPRNAGRISTRNCASTGSRLTRQ